jgi:hypothetical protein
MNPQRQFSKSAWETAHREQRREQHRQWYVAHPGKAREYSARHLERHPKVKQVRQVRERDEEAERRKAREDYAAHGRERARAYYAEHRDERRAYSKVYLPAHREVFRQAAQRFRECHPDYTKTRKRKMKAEDPARYRSMRRRGKKNQCPVHFCTNRKNRVAKLCAQCCQFAQWLSGGAVEASWLESLTTEDRTQWQNIRDKRKLQALRKRLTTTLQSQISEKKLGRLR